jgi:hypothetical protein
LDPPAAGVLPGLGGPVAVVPTPEMEAETRLKIVPKIVPKIAPKNVPKIVTKIVPKIVPNISTKIVHEIVSGTGRRLFQCLK